MKKILLSITTLLLAFCITTRVEDESEISLVKVIDIVQKNFKKK